ncbi:MAG: hypothetical protein ACM3MG_05065 [Bacillota bacterium]
MAALYLWGPLKAPPSKTLNASDVSTPPKTPVFNTTAPTPQPTPPPETALPLLGPHLRKIGDCLQIKNSLNDDASLSFTSLVDSMRGELGDLVTDQTDWKNVHITLPNGQKRRLRIEVEAMGEESSGLRLRYFGVDKDDLPIPIPLTDAQSKNPSEEYITSLENQGKVTLREEARRGLFSKGAEVYHTERNGFLSELELSYDGKGVKCQDLQGSHGTCNCF